MKNPFKGLFSRETEDDDDIPVTSNDSVHQEAAIIQNDNGQRLMVSGDEVTLLAGCLRVGYMGEGGPMFVLIKDGPIAMAYEFPSRDQLESFISTLQEAVHKASFRE